MAEELNLEEVRLMPVEDMTDEHKEFLKEHAEELNDDEKAAFQDFLTVADKKEEEGETEEAKAAREKAEAEKGEEPPVFKTREEADAWVEQKMKERDEAAAEKKKEEEAKAKGEEEIKFFDPTWEPKNWNDFAVNFFKALVSNPSLAKGMAPIIRAELDSMSAAEKKEMDAINDQFDKELDAMHKEGLIPDPKTPEGIKVDKQISLIGARMGASTMKEAYEQWARTPKEFGGGYDPIAKKTITQKQKAGMVSKSGGGAPPAEGKKSYADLHRKSLDTLLEEQ